MDLTVLHPAVPELTRAGDVAFYGMLDGHLEAVDVRTGSLFLPLYAEGAKVSRRAQRNSEWRAAVVLHGDA